jgi:type I restriction enzyme, S subunit
MNRRMNRTLDTLARRLFKSWFVDFDPVVAKSQGRTPFGLSKEMTALFPAELEDSDHGPIPRGWTMAPLDSIAEFRNGLAMQK